MPIADFQTLVKAHIPAEQQAALLKEVEQVFDTAGATEKVKQANADLTKQREEWEKREKDLKAKEATYTALETEKKALEAKVAELQKAGPDQAVLNGLNEKIADLTKRLNDKDEEAKKSAQERLAADLKSAVVSAAGDANDPAKVFILMQAEGLAGIKDDKPFFYKLNEKKEPVALEPQEAVKAYLDGNPYLKKSSGTGGSGTQPKNPGAQPQSGLIDNPEALLK